MGGQCIGDLLRRIGGTRDVSALSADRDQRLMSGQGTRLKRWRGQHRRGEAIGFLFEGAVGLGDAKCLVRC